MVKIRDLEVTIQGQAYRVSQLDPQRVDLDSEFFADQVVIIGGVSFIPKLPFEVGDFVYVLDADCLPRDYDCRYGKVVNVHGPQALLSVGVEFAYYSRSLHDLEGHTKGGHGYWVDTEKLCLSNDASGAD